MRNPLRGRLPPLEYRHLGRTLLLSIGVGGSVGLVACAFFWLLERAERLALEGILGAHRLMPAGEHAHFALATGAVRWWWMPVIPAVGALAAGLVAWRFAPETAGGGGDAYLEAFHHRQGIVRKRVAPLKMLTSVLTLGSGGAGGREGPTMQIGAAVGSLVGQWLRASQRERRLLVVAGTAGGIAAIFRTPLGAALLAAEVLYRDDFEADALVPCILASTMGYSVFVSVFGAGNLFAHAGRYSFHPVQLPLYVVMAVVLASAGVLFLKLLHGARGWFAARAWPVWAKPAVGGFAAGSIALGWMLLVNPRVAMQGTEMGVLGAGYGAAQAAILGGGWVPAGWGGVQLFVGLALVKMLATAATVGSGGSAGDFGPSVAIGGMLGGAFGRAAQLLFPASHIDPGAFALVGMGTFYGGIAHAPVSSLVMVCEMTGSYDLLVPLMAAGGVAFVALRGHGLYRSQLRNRFDATAQLDAMGYDLLRARTVGDALAEARRPLARVATLRRGSTVDELLRVVEEAAGQDVFPVMDAQGKMVGIVPVDVVRTLATERGVAALALADDLMVPAVWLRDDDDLHRALEVMLDAGLREVPVVDGAGGLVGLLDEADVARAYHDALDAMRERRTSALGSTH